MVPPLILTGAEADEIVAADADWGAASGRQYGGLLQVEGDPDAEIAILTLGVGILWLSR
jgi:hypothetical protein